MQEGKVLEVVVRVQLIFQQEADVAVNSNPLKENMCTEI